MKGVGLGLASTVAIVCLFLYDWPFSSIELALYDRALRLFAGESVASDEIVVAAIDSSSLQAIGAWPWPRARHAEAIESLTQAGAKAIYLDVGIFDPDRTDLTNDRRLIHATAEAGNVVYPMTFDEIEENGQKRIVPLEPLPELTAAAAGIAHAHHNISRDRVVRASHLAYRSEGRTYWGPSVELVRRYFGLPPDAIEPLGSNVVRIGTIDVPVSENSHSFPLAEYEMNIAFDGGRDAFASTPVVELLEGRFAQGAFDGKIVLYGATAAGFGDEHATSMSRVDRTPGIVIQGHAIATILDRRFVRTARLGSVVALTLLSGAGWGWARARWPRRCSAWTLLVLIGVLVLAYLFLMGALRLSFSFTPIAPGLVLTHVASANFEKRRAPDEGS